MEIAENITLAIATLIVLWQFLSLRHAVVNSDTIFPATIPSLIFFLISLATVVGFHFSPFHLIWLAVTCFILGIISIISPQVQALSMGFLGLLAITGFSQEDESGKSAVSSPNFSGGSKQKKENKSKGFGS